MSDQLLVSAAETASFQAIPAVAPAPPPHFIGRRPDLARLKAGLAADYPSPAIAIQGEDGAGKTAAARQLAHELRGRFRGGALWAGPVDYDGNPRPILRAWAAYCGADLTTEPDPLELTRTVRRLLVDRQVAQGPFLAIMDDVRPDQLDTVSLLHRALPPGCPLALTTTDRAVADALRATVYPLGSLPPADALVLLKICVGAARVETEPEAAQALLELLDCLPLGVELAGRRLARLAQRQPGYSLADLVGDLNRSIAGAHDLPAHRGLTGAFNLSYKTLPADQQRLFRWLAVFQAGPLREEHAAGLLALDPVETRRDLEELAGAALLAPGPVAGAYTLHPRLGRYAQILLKESGETAEATRRHLAYFLAFARANARVDPAAHTRLEIVLPDLQAAIEAASRLNADQALSDFGLALYADSHFLLLRGYAHEALSLFERAAGACRRLGHKRYEGVHLGHQGLAYQALGQLEKAIYCYQQALRIARQAGDRAGEGANLGNLGNAYSLTGELTPAASYYRQALAVFVEIEDKRGQEAALSNLGAVYYAEGKVETGLRFLEQALAIVREIGDRQEEEELLGQMGLIYYDLGRHRQAVEYLEQALAIARELDNRPGERSWWTNLGLAHHAQAQPDRAVDCYQQALRLARQMGDRRQEGDALGHLGLAYRDLGQRQPCLDALEKAIAILEEIGAPEASIYKKQLPWLKNSVLFFLFSRLLPSARPARSSAAQSQFQPQQQLTRD